MRYLSQILAISCLVSLSMPALGRCEFGRDVNEEIDADGLELVKVFALAGDLDVIGTALDGDDAGQIIITGRICTDSEENLERIRLDVESTADTVVFTVIIPHRHRLWDAEYASMDLFVSLPSSLAIEIRDSSGDIDLVDARVTQLNDSSGRIKVRNGKSSMKLNDSSGDIMIRGLDGELEISDSSGEIDLRDISGNIRIRRDSSGDISITNAMQDVKIDRDGSGSIDIDTVGGMVWIGSDGSGDIEIRAVTGSVRIGSDGSGTIRVADVGGDFDVGAKGSGSIRSRLVRGVVSIPR